MKYIQSQLNKRIKDVEKMREELSRVEQEKDEYLLSQQQYQDIIEAQQAELERVRDRLGITKDGGKVEDEPVAALADIEEPEEDEYKGADLATLEAAMNNMSKQVQTQQKMIFCLKTRTRVDANWIPPSAASASAGPKTFFARIDALKKGEVVGVLVDNAYKKRLIILSDDCKTINICKPKSPKTPLHSVPIDEVFSVTYPAKTSVKKAKKAMDKTKSYMKFRIDAHPKPFEVLATSAMQLGTLVVGIQNLTCKPGESMTSLGSFCWTKIRARLQQVALLEQVSPHEVLADVFSKTIAEDDDFELEED